MVSSILSPRLTIYRQEGLKRLLTFALAANLKIESSKEEQILLQKEILLEILPQQFYQTRTLSA